MALSFAELARCVSSSVSNQLRVFARARTQQSCKPHCKHTPQKMLVRDLTFFSQGRGGHRYIGRQHSLQLIERYILNLPNTNIHKSQAGTKYLGSKSGSYGKMPALTTSQLKRTKGLSRAASSTDVTTARGKKMGLRRHKLRFSSVAPRGFDFRLLKNMWRLDKDNKTDKLRNGSSNFIKNEIEFESQIQRNKTQANQAFIEKCAKAAGMKKEPLRFNQKKEPNITPSLKGSSQEPASQQKVTSPFFNLTKEMGDWLNAVRKRPTKVKKGDSKNVYRDQREIKSSTGNIELPNNYRKAYVSRSASNLSTEKMINVIRNDFRSLKQRSSEAKAQQTTQKKAGKDFGTNRNIEKINNEINRTRKDKFIERGGPMKQMPDRFSGKPKERGEILEIRPTYVENFPPDGTPRKKISSSQSFAGLNEHVYTALGGKSKKELNQDKQSVIFSKNTQKLNKVRNRSVPDMKYQAMSNEKGFVLVDTHAKSGEQGAFLRNFPENISKNASLSQNAEVSSKIRFSDIKRGNSENKGFILLDDDAASTHTAKLNQELLNEELTKQKRFTTSTRTDKLANEELNKQNGFILVDADKIQGSTVEDFETNTQEKDHVQPEIAQKFAKKEQKNVVLDNDNPHLSLRTTAKPPSRSRSQFVSANRDNRFNDNTSRKSPVATNTFPSFTFRDGKHGSTITRAPTKDYNQSAGSYTSAEHSQNIKNDRKEGEKRFSLLATAGETTEMQSDFLPSKNELRKWSQILERRLKELQSKAFGKTSEKYSSEMNIKPSNSKIKIGKTSPKIGKTSPKIGKISPKIGKTSPYKIKSAEDVRENFSWNVKKATRSASAEANTGKKKKKIASQISQTQVSAADFIARHLPKLLTKKNAPKPGDPMKEAELKPKQKHQEASSEHSLEYPSSVFMLQSTRLPRAEVNELRPEVKKKRDKSLQLNSKFSPEPQLIVKPEELSKKLKQSSSGACMEDGTLILKQTGSGPCVDDGNLKPQATSQSISLGKLTPIEDLVKNLQLHLKPDTEKKNNSKLHIYKQNFEKFISADVKKDSTKFIQPEMRNSNTYLLETMKTTPAASTDKYVDTQERPNKKKNKPLKKKAAAKTLSNMLLKPSSLAQKKAKSTPAKSTSYRRNEAVMQELREQWSKDFNDKLRKYKLDFYSSDFQKNDNCLVGSPNDAKTPPEKSGQAGNEVKSKVSSQQLPNKFLRKSDHLPTMGMAERLLAAAKKPPSYLDRYTTYDLINSDSSITDTTITPWTSEMEDLQEVDQFKEWVQSDLPESYKSVEPKNLPRFTERLEAIPKLFNLTQKTQDNTVKPAAESCVDAGSSIDGPYYRRPNPTDHGVVSTNSSTFRSFAPRNPDEFYDNQKGIPGSLSAATSNKVKDNYMPASQASTSIITEATAATDTSYVDTLTHSGYPKYPWDVGTMSTIFDSEKQEKKSPRRFKETTKGTTSKMSSSSPADPPNISKVLDSLDGVASLTVIPETPEPSGKALKSTLKRSRSREEKRVSFKPLATANSKTQDTTGLNRTAMFTAGKNLAENVPTMSGMSPGGSNLRKELAEQRVKDEKEARIKLIRSHTQQIREYERVLSKYRDQVGKTITAETD